MAQRVRLASVSALINRLIILVLFLIVIHRPAPPPPKVTAENRILHRLQHFIDTSAPSPPG